MRWAEYQRMWEALKSGDVEQLEAEARRQTNFPNGVDDYLGRRWIINAIDCKSLASVTWMLQKGVDLSFRDEEGYTPLHAAIESDSGDRLEILKLLLEARAPVNLKGVNDWTPAHMAAARDDVDALKILVQFGADLSIRTKIDDCATPLEEARNLRKMNAARYLESVV
jgi:ankyrin repeat protein